MSRQAMKWVLALAAMAACTARNPAYLVVPADAAVEEPQDAAPDARSIEPEAGADLTTPDAVIEPDAAADQAAAPDVPVSADARPPAPDAATSGLQGTYFEGM